MPQPYRTKSHPSTVVPRALAHTICCMLEPVDRIAKQIGVSKGVIAYHFPKKKEIVDAIIEKVVAAGRAYMTPRIIGALCPKANATETSETQRTRLIHCVPGRSSAIK